jgi:hypothetical protein
MADAKTDGWMPSGDESANRKAHDSGSGATVSRQTPPKSAMFTELGKAEELGQEDVGDIADEGRGHRG